MKKTPINSRLFELGVTQIELAKSTGYARSTVAAWANQYRIPPKEARRAIAQYLRCTQKSLWSQDRSAA